MAVGWVPCASRLGQKRRIKTAISPPPPPQQRKKWSGGAASAGGRPLCVVRGFSDTALDSEARHGTGIVTRGTARRCIFFPPSFLVIGRDGRWTLNIPKRQETLQARTWALQLPRLHFQSDRRPRRHGFLFSSRQQNCRRQTRGPPSARHLADGASLLRGLRAIPWLEGRVMRLFTLLAAEVNNRFGLHATVWKTPIKKLTVGKKWLYSRLKGNNVCKCLKAFTNNCVKTSV